jgi:hypothetical protein
LLKVYEMLFFGLIPFHIFLGGHLDALQRIKRAGFEVSLSGDTFTVSPASRLTPEQREFLKAHKAEIVKELSASDTTEPAPKPAPIPEPDGDMADESEHNATGRYFKWLITRPDGTQHYSCAMPRQTQAEVRAQYPDASHIQPVGGEDYPND